jgi:hypothetical protein
MAGITNIFIGKRMPISLNSGIAIGLISALTICSVKEIELHSQNIVFSDTLINLPSVSAYYGENAIGGQWL